MALTGENGLARGPRYSPCEQECESTWSSPSKLHASSTNEKSSITGGLLVILADWTRGIRSLNDWTRDKTTSTSSVRLSFPPPLTLTEVGSLFRPSSPYAATITRSPQTTSTVFVPCLNLATRRRRGQRQQPPLLVVFTASFSSVCRWLEFATPLSLPRDIQGLHARRASFHPRDD